MPRTLRSAKGSTDVRRAVLEQALEPAVATEGGRSIGHADSALFRAHVHDHHLRRKSQAVLLLLVEERRVRNETERPGKVL